ncbi:MAG: endolytic transglycosylase MltG [Eubacterium sp.]|nr:endolytic transglycosylase MltG [Eubacterium sp.]
MAKKKSAEARRKQAYKTEGRLRVALNYAMALLVDVIIVFVFVKAFSTSFNFAHDVFYDSAKNVKNTDYVAVTIEPDSSTSTISGVLYDAGVIKNKYVMMAKIKVSEVGGDIKSGTYKLSPSMKYSEIIGIITGEATSDAEKEEEKTEEDIDIDESEIHDNSNVGAGDGGAEGEDGYEPGDESQSEEAGDSQE